MSEPVRQEEDRVGTRLIITVGAIALVVFAVGIGWAVVIQDGQNGTLRNDTAPSPKLVGRQQIGMVYQPVFDRGRGIAAEKNAPQEKRLGEYGWVEEKKVAHIPIDRAMQLVVERGKL